MKKIGCLLLVLICFHVKAQMHEVSGGNIGVTLFGGGKMNTSSASDIKYSNGLIAGIGLTTSLAEVIFPEIHYSFASTKYGVDSIGNILENKSNVLGMSLNSKIPVYSLSLGKSSKWECWYMNIKLLLGYNYSINLSNKNNFNYLNKNDQLLEVGLGINPRYSGGHKSRVAWSFIYDFVYRLDFNKNDRFSIENQSDWKQNGFFFRLTILHYKTFDFLGGTSKKKSYKRKF